MFHPQIPQWPTPRTLLTSRKEAKGSGRSAAYASSSKPRRIVCRRVRCPDCMLTPDLRRILKHSLTRRFHRVPHGTPWALSATDAVSGKTAPQQRVRAGIIVSATEAAHTNKRSMWSNMSLSSQCDAMTPLDWQRRHSVIRAGASICSRSTSMRTVCHCRVGLYPAKIGTFVHVQRCAAPRPIKSASAAPSKFLGRLT